MGDHNRDVSNDGHSPVAGNGGAQTETSLPSKWTTRAALIWARITLVVTIITALNVATHITWLAELSKSIGWIVGWARFFVRSLFRWLHVDISPLAQDALTLLALVLGTANLYSLYRFRSTLLPVYLPVLKSSEPLKARLRAETKGWSPAYLASAAIVYVLVIIIGVEIPLLGFLVLALVMFGLMDMTFDYLLPRRQKMWKIAPFGPFTMLAAWIVVFAPMLVANAHRWIIRSVGVVLLLLALNYMFIAYADPLARLVKELPQAPPA